MARSLCGDNEPMNMSIGARALMATKPSKPSRKVLIWVSSVGTAADKNPHFCSICCDNGIRMHMASMPCCQQYLHTTGILDLPSEVIELVSSKP